MKSIHIANIVQPDTRNGPHARGMPENKVRVARKIEMHCRDDTGIPPAEIEFVWHNSVKRNCYTGPPGRNGPYLIQETELRPTGTTRADGLMLSG